MLPLGIYTHSFYIYLYLYWSTLTFSKGFFILNLSQTKRVKDNKKSVKISFVLWSKFYFFYKRTIRNWSYGSKSAEWKGITLRCFWRIECKDTWGPASLQLEDKISYAKQMSDFPLWWFLHGKMTRQQRCLKWALPPDCFIYDAIEHTSLNLMPSESKQQRQIYKKNVCRSQRH